MEQSTNWCATILLRLRSDDKQNLWSGLGTINDSEEGVVKHVSRDTERKQSSGRYPLHVTALNLKPEQITADDGLTYAFVGTCRFTIMSNLFHLEFAVVAVMLNIMTTATMFIYVPN